MGPVEKIIAEKIEAKYKAVEMSLLNESHMHSGPATESHFKLFLVAPEFDGLSRVDRQRAVFDLLAEELAGPVHALSLRLLTPAEWQKQNQSAMPDSPDCAGANKSNT
ncbi:MAG: BolA family transcriptional regulator [Bdellovibrionales bacterium]|nr:BolA family transcriptional regulator [Bdellovibrionales bacterium]